MLKDDRVQNSSNKAKSNSYDDPNTPEPFAFPLYAHISEI